MASIPSSECPTLQAADLALEAVQEKPRSYLGISSIGHPCDRHHWYYFRWAEVKANTAQELKRFEDGHVGEDMQAKRLRAVEGVELITSDGSGNQVEYSDHGGHYKGHSDGLIKGIYQAPKTQHIWEHKQVDIEKFEKLKRLKAKDEKTALEKWDETYYAQAVSYMHYENLTRHYLTCSTPGGRESISVRTDANKELAIKLKAKAESVIRSPIPPSKISEKHDYFLCSWCDYKDICHGEKIPQVNCRTCCFSTPEINGSDGEWTCAKFGKATIPNDGQRVGCGSHLYIPTLLNRFADATDADALEPQKVTWIEYQKPDGTVFKNGVGGLSSTEIKQGRI